MSCHWPAIIREVCVLLAVDNSKISKQTRQLHSGTLNWPWMLKTQHRARISHTTKPRLLVYFHRKDFLLLLSGWEHSLQDFVRWIIPVKDPVLAKKELLEPNRKHRLTDRMLVFGNAFPYSIKQFNLRNRNFLEVSVHNRNTLTSEKVLDHNSQIFSGTLETWSWLLFFKD